MTIDYKRALNDFVYFATHCIIDGRTGKPFKWTKVQFRQLLKLNKICNNHE